MRTIAVANQKGGVAKTTTALSVGAALAMKGIRTLIVDMDPQANLTTAIGIQADELQQSVFDILTDGHRVNNMILRTKVENLDILPADIRLASAERQLYGTIGFDEILKMKLAPLKAEYSFAVIDCPPSLGLLTINAMTAADLILVPVQCEYLSAKGLTHLLEVLETIKERRNPNLTYRVLPTLFDKRNRICTMTLEQLQQNFSGRIYNTVIGVDTKLREAAAVGRPITVYSPSSRASEQYSQLIEEIIADAQN